MTVYIDRPSSIHNLDPRVKIAWSVVVSILAVIFRNPTLLGGLFVLTLLPWCLIRPPLSRLRWLLLLIGTTILGTMISQGFFYGRLPRTELLTILPGLSLCKEGVIYGGDCVAPSAFGTGSRSVGGVYHLPLGLDPGNDQVASPPFICLYADVGFAFPSRNDRTGETYFGCPTVTRCGRKRISRNISTVSTFVGALACRFFA